MACCIECGRELEPGEGRAPVKFDWRHPNGLVCKDCYDGQKGFIGGFGLLVVGAIVGLISANLFLDGVVNMCGSYDTFRTAAICSGVVAALLFLICKIKYNRIPGCLTRLIVKITCFLLLSFAVSILYCVYSKDGESLKAIWPDKANAAANVSPAESPTEQ